MEDAAIINKMRSMPQSDVEFNNNITIPKWGDEKYSQHLNDVTTVREVTIILRKGDRYVDSQTKEERIAERDVFGYKDSVKWKDLAILTQDIRLSNLNDIEVHYINTMGNLSGDCVAMNCPSSTVSSLQRVAVTVEVSQGRNMALRNNLVSIKHEKTIETKEPQKRGIFGNAFSFNKNKQGAPQ